MIKNIDGCKNNSEKPYTMKESGHILWRYSMSTIQAFDGIQNKHDVYRGEDCMEKFHESLREHAVKVVNFEKKEMIQLTNKHQESCEKTKICYISKKN